MAQAGGSGPALRCAQRMAPGNTDLGQTTHLRHYSQPAAHRVQEYVNAFVERATKVRAAVASYRSQQRQWSLLVPVQDFGFRAFGASAGRFSLHSLPTQ